MNSQEEDWDLGTPQVMDPKEVVDETEDELKEVQPYQVKIPARLEELGLFAGWWDDWWTEEDCEACQ